jgi:hypothetical protein
MRLKHLLFSIISLLPSVTSYALYCGNPSFPMMPEEGLFSSQEGWFGMKAGYESDNVFNRPLHMKKQASDQLKHAEESDGFANYGVLTLTFMERVELYGNAGAMSCKISQHPYSNTHVHYRMKSHFAWGVGGRAILAYWKEWQLGAAAAYLNYSPPIHSIVLNRDPLSADGAKMRLREWQIGAALSYQWKWLIPYLGGDYSDERIKLLHMKSLKNIFSKSHVRLKGSQPIGFIIGCGLSPEKGFNVNVEGRFFNETAFTASADLKF